MSVGRSCLERNFLRSSTPAKEIVLLITNPYDDLWKTMFSTVTDCNRRFLLKITRTHKFVAIPRDVDTLEILTQKPSELNDHLFPLLLGCIAEMKLKFFTVLYIVLRMQA